MTTTSVPRLAASRSTARPRRQVASALPRRNVGSLPFLAAVAALLTATLIGLLIVNNSLAAGSFEHSRLKSERILLGEQEQALSQEVQRLSSPTRVRETARAAGMIAAATTVYLDVDTGEILGIPLPAGETQNNIITPIIDPATGQPIAVPDASLADPVVPDPATAVIPADPAAPTDAAAPGASIPTPAPTAVTPDTGATNGDGAAVVTPPGGTAYDRAIVSGGGQ